MEIDTGPSQDEKCVRVHWIRINVAKNMYIGIGEMDCLSQQ